MLMACANPRPSGETEPAASDPMSEHEILALLAHYKYKMTDLTSARWSPFYCRMMPMSEDSHAEDSEHGRKAYFLWSDDPGAYYDIAADAVESAPVGMTLVKESWTPLEEFEGSLHWISSENMLYSTSPEVLYSDQPALAEPYGLFVMHKLEPGTPHTDNGWVYATTDFEGTEVFEVGRIASCIGCHESAPHDRLYGVVKADDIVREHDLYELRTASERALRVDQSLR